MQLFYEANITQPQMQLSADNMRHIVQVLRMAVGDSFLLTDGCGAKCKATICAIVKKDCIVKINEYIIMPMPNYAIDIGISFTKSTNRIEWLLEKITEIGVANIYPLHTKRTEQLFPKKERLQHILISAMCQSKQYYLPILHNMVTIDKLVACNHCEQNFIAHCIENEPKHNLLAVAKPNKSSLILIGPEGDFTPDEVSLCLQNKYLPISLGNTRLRTETAGLVAITILNQL